MIYEKYLPGGLTDEETQTVRRIDDACLYYEFLHFKGERLFAEQPELARMPEYEIRPFREVEEAFLRRFTELFSNCSE